MTPENIQKCKHWILSQNPGDGPCPPLIIHGPAASGKSVLAIVLAQRATDHYRMNQAVVSHSWGGFLHMAKTGRPMIVDTAGLSATQWKLVKSILNVATHCSDEVATEVCPAVPVILTTCSIVDIPGDLARCCHFIELSPLPERLNQQDAMWAVSGELGEVA